jgi:hypothetical protein
MHDLEFDWRGLLAALILALLTFAVGPLTLVLTWGTRAWATRSRFDPGDRWDSIRAFAWVFGALIVLIILAFFILPTQVFHLWSISPLHVLGTPNLLSNLWLRWLGSLPLAFALSFVLERGNPRTLRGFRHIGTATERAQRERHRAQEQAKRAQAEERAARLAATPHIQTSTAPREAPRRFFTTSAEASTPTSQAPQAPGESVAPATGQDKATLWDELPPEHPWKQEAKREQDQLRTPPGQEAKPSTTPASPAKKEKPKPPDLGDGSMDALL